MILSNVFHLPQGFPGVIVIARILTFGYDHEVGYIAYSILGYPVVRVQGSALRHPGQASPAPPPLLQIWFAYRWGLPHGAALRLVQWHPPPTLVVEHLDHHGAAGDDDHL